MLSWCRIVFPVNEAAMLCTAFAAVDVIMEGTSEHITEEDAKVSSAMTLAVVITDPL